MYPIKIVGMGPGGKDYLTLAAMSALTGQGKVYLRTDRHPVVEDLVQSGMVYTSFDDYYDQFETFEEVYRAIADEIKRLSETEPVTYAVPGNPFVAEKTVSYLMNEVADQIEIVHGASFIDAIVTALHYDPVGGLVIADALNIENERIDTSKDHLFIQVYDQTTASMLKLELMNFWPDEKGVTIIKGAGIPNVEMIKKVPLYELDHQPDDFNHLTSLFVSGGEGVKHELFELETIMRKLRAEDGCPWDREQTHESLTPYLIEEAYEVKEAIDEQDDEALVDELGDVLLQIVFHATIASEDGYFEMSDIIKAVCDKMIRRHPHVFSNVVVKDSDEVLTNWQAIKNQEKDSKNVTDSMLAVSKSLPGHIRSQKVQKKAADVGFDWKSASDAVSKIEEELNEVKEALANGDEAALHEEMGDLLLIIGNVARLSGIDAEQALVDATEKFIKRFSFIEAELEKEGLSPSPQLLERMEALWTLSKKW